MFVSKHGSFVADGYRYGVKAHSQTRRYTNSKRVKPESAAGNRLFIKSSLTVVRYNNLPLSMYMIACLLNLLFRIQARERESLLGEISVPRQNEGKKKNTPFPFQAARCLDCYLRVSMSFHSKTVRRQ